MRRKLRVRPRSRGTMSFRAASSSEYRGMAASIALDFVVSVMSAACHRMFDLYPDVFFAEQTKH